MNDVSPLAAPKSAIVFVYNGCTPLTLLHTKTLVPLLRPHLLPRPRLIERLERGLQPGLHSAPAAYRKTTALIQRALASNAPIGWLNTFNYVHAAEKYGVDVALVTQRFGFATYNGQINVNAAGIETLEDLGDKVMCWVDPNSTSGYIIPRIMLRAEGIDPDEDFAQTLNAGGHNNVIIQVYKGECDAGTRHVDAHSAVEGEFPEPRWHQHRGIGQRLG